MFIGAFQNGVRANHFNESLTHMSANSLAEVVTRVECYIKGSERNAKKKARDVKIIPLVIVTTHNITEKLLHLSY